MEQQLDISDRPIFIFNFNLIFNIIPKFQLDSGVYVTGSSVIDGTNAYAYASSGSSAYTSGSIITYELQVSGS